MHARDGALLAVRRIPASPEAPSGAPPLVLLHATLSTSRQLVALGSALASAGPVLLLDRRGSGDSRLAVPVPLNVATHVDDLEDVLDAEAIRAAVLVGHSFGGVVALEAAARLVGRVAAVVAWEAPYAAVADTATREALESVALATVRAGLGGGPAAAAETFMNAVAGRDAWAAMPARTRSFLEDEGGGAIADVGLVGLDPAMLDGIRAPVGLLTGDASEPFYAAIADALAVRIPHARRVRLAGLRHPAPITDAAPVAAAVLALLPQPALPGPVPEDRG